MKSYLSPAAGFSALLLIVGLAGRVGAQDYWGDTGAPAGAGAATGASAYGADYGYDEGADYGSDSGSSGGGAMGSLLGESAFNYGYLDASYYWFDFDEDNFDNANGFGAALSIPLLDTIYLKGAANYAASETEDGEDVDYLDWQAGVGVGLPLMNRFDLILEGGLAHRSLEVDSINDFGDLTDGYGWYAAPGVRVGVTDFLEINGTVRYTSVDDADDLGIDVRALLHLTPTISINGGVLFSDDANQYGVGLRINF